MVQFWIQDDKPKWLPTGFQVPYEMMDQVKELSKQAENVYYSVDLERNGFLRKKEFKKALKKLGINKFEAKHMLILVNQERLDVVSIKNYVNAYLFIKSGGLSHINADYQGPLTSSVDKRTHMKNTHPEGEPLDLTKLASFKQVTEQLSSSSFSSIAQNIFNQIPRPKYIVGYYQSMKANNGMYLCSENGRVIADRPVAGPWERFYLLSDTDWTDEKCCLKTWWNNYLCCENDDKIADNRTAIGPWEKFIVDIPPGSTGGQNAYRSWTGHYLTADAAGNVSFSATSIGPNEIWNCKVLGTVYL